VIGVVISAIVVFSGVSAPLALVGPGFETPEDHCGLAFAVIAVCFTSGSCGCLAARST